MLKKLHKVYNRPKGENSPNLVTLPFEQKRSKLGWMHSLKGMMMSFKDEIFNPPRRSSTRARKK
jgi:hypothetical protein